MNNELREALIVNIVALLITILIFGSIGLYSYYKAQDIKQDTELCRNMGYDGVKFVSKYTNEVQCSNFTDLERAKSSTHQRGKE